MAKNYQIHDLEAISGIKASTIRMWEMRYNLISPERTESNRRYYNEANFKKFLLITQLYYSNVKISQIAKFTNKQLQQKALDLNKSSDEYEAWETEIYNCIINFDSITLQNTFREAVMAYDVNKTFIFILFPLLHKIDVLWKTETLSIHHRQFAFENTYRFLYTAIYSISKYIIPEPGKKVLLYSNSDEMNVLQLLFAEIVFKKSNFNTTLLYSIENQDDLFSNLGSFKAKTVVTIAPMNQEQIDTFIKIVKSNTDTTFYFIDTKYIIDENLENLRIINNLEELEDEVF